MIVAAAVIPGAPLLLAEPPTPETTRWRDAAKTALTEAMRAEENREQANDAGSGSDARPDSSPHTEAEPAVTELLVVASVATGAITEPDFSGPPMGLRVAREIIDLAAEAGAFDPNTLPVEEVAIAEDATAEEAATLGLVAGSFPVRTGSDEEARTVLLVVADGSRVANGENESVRAEGQQFDEHWQRALGEGNGDLLAALGGEAAARVRATCRAPLQVLATASDGRRVTARLLDSGYLDGIGGAAAVWRCE